jgi:hypothetical protein
MSGPSSVDECREKNEKKGEMRKKRWRKKSDDKASQASAVASERHTTWKS